MSRKWEAGIESNLIKVNNRHQDQKRPLRQPVAELKRPFH
ncbi:hypothetical protein F0Z19_3558 [Vibrio cyclitrophicus]|nr:hypothetical protein F0Z19_3558 [Vibrio cyclitrophicus]